MSIRNKLKKYVSDTQPIVKGTVMRVTKDSIMVSSPKGVKEFKIDNTSILRPNDQVRFQGNLYLGKVPPEKPGKVFVV